MFAASCRVMKRQRVVATPKTVNEQKKIETEAKSAYEQGDYIEAISNLKALIAKEPDNPEYWGRLGSSYAQVNQFSYAEYAYKKALKNDPKNVKAMYNLSVIYSEKGRSANALKMVQRALKYDPKNPLLQASLGNVLIDKEKYDKAKILYERIVKVKPEFDVGHYNLGVINYQERKLDEAEKNYEDVLRINDRDFEAKENLAAIKILKGDFEAAVSHLKDVINSNPGDDITLENAYYNLGVAYLRMKEYRKSLEAFETALKIEPWDMSAYVNAAIICEKLGEKKKAIKYWEKYDRLLPVNKRKEEIKKRLKAMGVEYNPTPAPTEEPTPEKKKKKLFNWKKKK